MEKKTTELTIVQQLAKKLEYRFKKSQAGVDLLNRIANNDLQSSDLPLLLKKQEYTWKNSDKGKAIISLFRQIYLGETIPFTKM